MGLPEDACRGSTSMSYCTRTTPSFFSETMRAMHYTRHAIEREAAYYGLTLNRDKCAVLRMNDRGTVRYADGRPVRAGRPLPETFSVKPIRDYLEDRAQKLLAHVIRAPRTRCAGSHLRVTESPPTSTRAKGWVDRGLTGRIPSLESCGGAPGWSSPRRAREVGERAPSGARSTPRTPGMLRMSSFTHNYT